VHLRVLDESVANHAVLGNQLVAEGLEAEGPEGDNVRRQVGARIAAAKLREFSTLGVVLGDSYVNSPVVAAEEGGAAVADFINYVPSAMPGRLAPHAWMHDGSSLYDHFGAGFTLLAMPDASCAELDLARRHAALRGVPLQVVQRAEPALPSLYGARYTLVRPDQHVAWRGAAWPAAGEALLDQVTGRAAPMCASSRSAVV